MYTKIPIAGMDRKEWLALRKTGIGGSDAGAICGVNPRYMWSYSGYVSGRTYKDSGYEQNL